MLTKVFVKHMNSRCYCCICT